MLITLKTFENHLKWLCDFKLGFNVRDFSEDAIDDIESLDASAVHVANLLSAEPPDSRFLSIYLFIFLSANKWDFIYKKQSRSPKKEESTASYIEQKM